MFTIDKKLFTIPFFLTISRIVIIPFLAIALMVHQWNVALCLFTLAAMTDVLDGAFARLFNEETKLGAYLDPIGDKLLTLTTFGILAFGHSASHLVPLWLFYVILAKELVLILVAAYMMHIKSDCIIHAGWAGKMAMLIQTTFIFIVLLAFFAEYPLTNLYTLSLMHYCIVAGLVVSLAYYGYQLVRCKNKKSTAAILFLGLAIPAMLSAKKSEFIIKQEQTKTSTKRSLNQARQDAADQLESIAHNLVYEIEAASKVLHDVMHSIRTIAEGNTKKGTVAYLKCQQDACMQAFEDLEQATCARTAQLKTKHVWFEEAVFSCNLSTSPNREKKK